MFDFKPVGYVVGLFLLCVGAAMLAPALLDYWSGSYDWRAFLVSAVLTCLTGGALVLGCDAGKAARLSIPQTFLLVVATWVLLPIFGALPFLFGDINATPIDALFEAVSGLTTTGATVFTGLELAPPGVLIWRGLLQWIGGVGVVIFAVAFLPSLRIGGMQLFARADGGDPEAVAIYAVRDIGPPVLLMYSILTAACAVAYGLCGMQAFDALTHALTTVATGGFGNYDRSFAEVFPPAVEYAAIFFMIASALPLLRYVEVAQGRTGAFAHDPQVRGFLIAVVAAAAVVFVGRFDASDGGEISVEAAFRQALFNTVSLMTGTGYSSADYNDWGPIAIATLFAVGLIGGCAGSSSCSVKIFRYQILGAIAIREFRRARYPNGAFTVRYAGQRVSHDVETSVVAFFFLFLASLVVITVLLCATGLDLETAFSGAASALANIGPGFGETIGPTGSFRELPDTSKAILIIAMLLGRLELISVLVLLSPAFWRR